MRKTIFGILILAVFATHFLLIYCPRAFASQFEFSLFPALQFVQQLALRLQSCTRFIAFFICSRNGQFSNVVHYSLFTNLNQHHFLPSLSLKHNFCPSPPVYFLHSICVRLIPLFPVRVPFALHLCFCHLPIPDAQQLHKQNSDTGNRVKVRKRTNEQKACLVT